MTGYKDYMVLLRPDEVVCTEVKQLKAFVHWHIGSYKSMHSTAHISVTRYHRQKPYIIEQMIDNLQYRLKKMPTVNLRIYNFQCFDHKNGTFTIFAAIEPAHTSDEWFKLLRKQFNLSQLYPHITIARTIDENSFLRLWPHFRYRTCRFQFTINCITILERQSHNDQAKWAIYRETAFKINKENAEVQI